LLPHLFYFYQKAEEVDDNDDFEDEKLAPLLSLSSFLLLLLSCKLFKN